MNCSIKALIVDLDQTLIDSRMLQALRDKRDWPNIYRHIPDVQPFGGINELLIMLNNNNIKIAIVTSAPRPYCEKIISHNKWKVDATVCYHDTVAKKPHPDPILTAINKLNVTKEESVSAGDRDIDILASKKAGVVSIACLWGTEDRDELLLAQPDLLMESVDSFSDYWAGMLGAHGG